VLRLQSLRAVLRVSQHWHRIKYYFSLRLLNCKQFISLVCYEIYLRDKMTTARGNVIHRRKKMLRASMVLALSRSCMYKYPDFWVLNYGMQSMTLALDMMACGPMWADDFFYDDCGDDEHGVKKM
jgi:hypothetical protein